MSGSCRKEGRERNRPSHKSYNASSRWIGNKEKAIKRDRQNRIDNAARIKARKDAKKPQRGDARNKLREQWKAAGGRSTVSFARFKEQRI